MLNSSRLIVTYTPNSYYALEDEGKFFIITRNEIDGSEEIREVADAAALENEALALLNEDCQPEVDGVYLPEEGLEKYFTGLAPLEGLDGCYSGFRGDNKFIIVPRHIIEYDALGEDAYLPFLFAHLYPPEEETEELFTLLRDMLKG